MPVIMMWELCIYYVIVLYETMSFLCDNDFSTIVYDCLMMNM